MIWLNRQPKNECSIKYHNPSLTPYIFNGHSRESVIAMDAPIIFYCGPRNLESAALKAYMGSLGFQVQISQDVKELFETLHSVPALCTILPADKDRPEFQQLIQQIRDCVEGPCYPILILSSVPFTTDVSFVYVFRRPTALKQLADQLKIWLKREQLL